MSTAWLRYGPGKTLSFVGVVSTIAFVTGGLLVVWSSYIHFHLWQNAGYRHIATIGPLFHLQSIAGLLLGLLIIVVRRVWVAVLGVGFAVSTMFGFLISVEHGLFGFKDAWSSPFAHQAFFIEVATIVILGIAGTLCLLGSAPDEEQAGSPSIDSLSAASG